MKSLEFINKDLQDFEKALENYKRRKAINNEEVDEEYIKQMTKEIENYNQIKQDLEVLEILKNKNINVGRFKARCYISSDPHQLMRTYNCDCNYIDDELSIDEVIKLKQWLEENE